MGVALDPVRAIEEGADRRRVAAAHPMVGNPRRSSNSVIARQWLAFPGPNNAAAMSSSLAKSGSSCSGRKRFVI